jgi:CheY-like chemotaxis protein/MinD-like ATPase involved in chromosome partitioning or flagellar assembly
MADKPHILVVDDELDARNLVRLVLTGQGYTVSEASDGLAAVEKAVAEQPDLILLDVMMPKMNGYDVARALRADERIGDVPIVMFTAKGQIDDQAEGYEAGVDDYVTKPTHPADLIARVKAVLARRQAGAAPEWRAHVIGCLGTSPGAGVTTTAVNLAAALGSAGDGAVILTEITPAEGGLTAQLGVEARQPSSDLSAEVLAKHLVGFPGPIDILALEEPLGTGPAEDLVRGLASLCDYLIVDLGDGLDARSYRLARLLDWLVIVTAPVRQSLGAAYTFVNGFRQEGLEGRISMALVHRPDCAQPVNYPSIRSGLDLTRLHVVPSAPAVMAASIEAQGPAVLVQPNSDVGVVYHSLADEVLDGVGDKPNDE